MKRPAFLFLCGLPVAAALAQMAAPSATPPPATLAPATLGRATPAPVAGAPAAQPAFVGEWVVLFDGEKAPGLRGYQKADFLKAGWKIEEGALKLTKTVDETGKQTGGDLVAIPNFVDYEFEWEWKLSISGDSGVLYCARPGGSGGRVLGYEFQIIDDVRNPDSMKGGKIRRTGSVDRFLAATAEVTLNDNNWNLGRLIVKGNHVEHWVNGDLVLAYDFGSLELMRGIRASKMRLDAMFGYKVKSPVVILDQGEEAAYRGLRIRSLSAADPVTVLPPARTVQPGVVSPVRGGPTPFKSRIPR